MNTFNLGMLIAFAVIASLFIQAHAVPVETIERVKKHWGGGGWGGGWGGHHGGGGWGGGGGYHNHHHGGWGGGWRG